MTLKPALTPPMGWNSWDCYGTTITEDEVLANARFMAEHLAPFGWDTIVIDADWADPGARSHGYNAAAELHLDEYGRLVPDPVRFPSAADGAGFGPLAEQVHALGLRFGIHIMRGLTRRAIALRTPILGTGVTAADIADPDNVCEWNPHYVGMRMTDPAAQAYYDSLAALYAEWGVDFVKADDLLWPYQRADIEALSQALGNSGREFQLSLSPGRDMSLARLDHLRENATMWRICDDVWDRWQDVEDNFARFARWAPHAGPQGWPDGDMLPLGRIGIRAERGAPRQDGFTPAERTSLMTLWVIARSPLMIGGDLPTSDPATVALFTNADVIEVLRSSSNNRELAREGAFVFWGADGADGVRYAAVFHLGETPVDIALDAQALGLPASGGEVRELWSGAVVALESVSVQSNAARGVAPGSAALRLSLDAHGAALLRFTPLT
ncbi:MAG TPA: alpha-galactosidase [Arachnia sp.]|nr:alpha-galactosidase [Arachnia sp.]HMT84745.1 alpha-galactosidase [Arachnia sp.]